MRDKNKRSQTVHVGMSQGQTFPFADNEDEFAIAAAPWTQVARLPAEAAVDLQATRGAAVAPAR